MGQLKIRHAALGFALAALIALPGCMTSEKRAEQAQLKRQAESRMNVGAEYLAAGRVALALREFREAERFDPNNARVHYYLGDAYRVRGMPVEAETHLRRAVEIDPDYHDPRLRLTGLLLVAERDEEAIAECNVLIEDPTFPGIWRALANRGLAERRLGRLAAARKTLELALEYRADYWPALMSLAAVDVDEGQQVEGIRRYQDVIALEPGPVVESEANYRLAQVYIALGNRRQAVGHLSTAVARAPKGVWARKSQEYLDLLH